VVVGEGGRWFMMFLSLTRDVSLCFFLSIIHSFDNSATDFRSGLVWSEAPTGLCWEGLSFVLGS